MLIGATLTPLVLILVLSMLCRLADGVRVWMLFPTTLVSALIIGLPVVDCMIRDDPFEIYSARSLVWPRIAQAGLAALGVAGLCVIATALVGLNLGQVVKATTFVCVTGLGAGVLLGRQLYWLLPVGWYILLVGFVFSSGASMPGLADPTRLGRWDAYAVYVSGVGILVVWVSDWRPPWMQRTIA
jgi:hypothetical protein